MNYTSGPRFDPGLNQVKLFGLFLLHCHELVNTWNSLAGSNNERRGYIFLGILFLFYAVIENPDKEMKGEKSSRVYVYCLASKMPLNRGEKTEKFR